jgi:hypothetical protein
MVKNFDDLVKVYFSNLRMVAIKKDGDFFGEIAIE